MLRAGFGGLVLCAKPDEARTWARYAREAGREGDLVFFSPESAEVGGVAGRGQDEVWERAMRQLLRNAADLCRLSGRELRMELVHRLALGGLELCELLDEARERTTTENDRADLDAVGRYFMVEWANMAERTRSGVVMNLTAVCDPFLRGSLRDLFCRETTVTPEDAHQGSIIIVDLPVKTFNELGRYAAAIWKFLFQRAAERREIGPETRPLFLFADECQLFVTSTDAAFQSTARSARVATVFLTQNLPNLYAEMAGGGPAGKQRADALLGNLQTKIFHQNSDHETNKWRGLRLLRRAARVGSSQVPALGAQTSDRRERRAGVVRRGHAASGAPSKRQSAARRGREDRRPGPDLRQKQ
ncbi:type IV secretory system conjugative DNA transfer family protein [Haloferula chungangensis]|uniref:Type IV secretory system conjugative DNA transfer family protein n=1 Tax=Haloferula chungangensis TaxID=1048331 RepID=A0ABW2LEW0_9BACT